MKQIRCFVLKNGKVAVGFVEESARFYEIEGMYLQAMLGEDMTGKPGDMKGHLQYTPFSPVGGLVSKIKIPVNNIDYEQSLPEGIAFHMQYMLNAETRNIERKRQLAGMRIPGRTGLTPEQSIALVTQFMEKNGRLPSGFNVSENMRTLAGTFDVKPTSPYREEFGDNIKG